MAGEEMPEEPEPVRLPITPELDLHLFRPNEVGDLVPDYLEECRREGIHQVRVIHGKGTGTLRTRVHRILERLEFVEDFTWPAGAGSGGWGATWAQLRPLAAEQGGRDQLS